MLGHCGPCRQDKTCGPMQKLAPIVQRRFRMTVQVPPPMAGNPAWRCAMRKLIIGLAASAWCLCAGAAMAASGTALGVDPAAQAERGNKVETLVVGADIFIGDRVVTGAAGQVQIKFSDSTELVVGPDSALLIEDYLLRNDGSAGQLAVNALAGSFRFVTGSAPKDRYRISTPTGTIGVRGTAFDFFVTSLITSVLLYDGSVVFCNDAGDCETLAKTCDLGQFDGSEAQLIGHTDTVGGADRERLRTMFRYAQSQLPLLREFRVNEAERCLNRPAGGGGVDSLVETGPDSGQPAGRPTPQSTEGEGVD